MAPIYIMIEQDETGRNIRRLRREKGLRVRDIQEACGFEQPQAVYKWLSGQSLPSIDNLLILTKLLSTTVEGILVTSGDALPRSTAEGKEHPIFLSACSYRTHKEETMEGNNYYKIRC